MWDDVAVLSAVGAGLLACIIALIFAMRVPAPGKPKRFCPLCKSELDEKETLKGLIVDTKPPQKILIRGCSKCAPPEEGGSW
ncbi:hypothetical protein HY522_05785 [bacterium]|nr:hypothetical protein [bacterium]